MDNVDVATRYQLWFFVSAGLAAIAFCLKLINLIAIYIDNLPFFAFTQISKFVIGAASLVWFFIGTYWRYSAWGQLCAEKQLSSISQVLSLLYYSGVVLSLCCCSCYSCGTIIFVSRS